MSSRFFSLFLFIALCTAQQANARDGWNRLHVSCTLSGHILFGCAYEHGFNDTHAVHVSLFPLIIPGKGLPFAFAAGYNYYFDTSPWQPKLGLDFAAIVSPPDPDKRKMMPLLMVTPGVVYVQNDQNSFMTEFWLAHFLTETNQKFPLLPIGWKFDYGYKM